MSFRELYRTLLTKPGTFIRRRKSIDLPGYCIYSHDMKPEKWFSEKAFKELSPLLKKDKKGRYTLDLQTVRRYHGNSFVKRLYKNERRKVNAG